MIGYDQEIQRLRDTFSISKKEAEELHIIISSGDNIQSFFRGIDWLFLMGSIITGEQAERMIRVSSSPRRYHPLDSMNVDYPDGGFKRGL
jgi:hypothetical protein